MGCCVCYVLFWACFFERLCGLFVVVVLVIDFAVNWWDGFSCLFVMFCFLGVIDWMVAGIVCRDCLMWLIVPVGCFLLNGCDFVRNKKNKGLTVHCNVAFVKPYVKMSALWSLRLFLLILVSIVCCENVFLFWTSFCEWRKLNRLPNRDGYCSCVEESAAGCCLILIVWILWRKRQRRNRRRTNDFWL